MEPTFKDAPSSLEEDYSPNETEMNPQHGLGADSYTPPTYVDLELVDEIQAGLSQSPPAPAINEDDAMSDGD
eukprot:415489-Pyramimonas_sp.AAC.1